MLMLWGSFLQKRTRFFLPVSGHPNIVTCHVKTSLITWEKSFCSKKKFSYLKKIVLPLSKDCGQKLKKQVGQYFIGRIMVEDIFLSSSQFFFQINQQYPKKMCEKNFQNAKVKVYVCAHRRHGSNFVSTF